MPGEEAAPARVEDGDARAVAVDAGERDRQAVGGHREHRQVGSSVHRPSPGSAARAGSARWTTCEWIWRFRASRSSVGADLGAEPPAVLVHALDVVAAQPAEVERLVRALADAADAGREDDLVRARAAPSGSSRHAPAPPRRAATRGCSAPDRSTRSRAGARAPRPSSGPGRQPAAIRSFAVDRELVEPVRPLRARRSSELRGSVAARPRRRSPRAARRASPAGRPRLWASRSNASSSPWR